MKKADYFLFSTDADRKLRHLSDSDFREVFCAVFNCLRDGVEPEFDNYLLYDYYEKVLSTPYFFLSTYDPSRRRKKKTDEIRPPENASTIVNCNGKAKEDERVENAILEYIGENLVRYKNGVTLPTMYKDMEYINANKEKLEAALDRLSDKGKIQVRQLNEYTFSIRLLEAV